MGRPWPVSYTHLLPLALLPSGTAQWVQELSWLQDLSTVAAQAHSFVAYFGSLTGRYASIRDADLVEEVRQLLASSNPQDGTLDPDVYKRQA